MTPGTPRRRRDEWPWPAVPRPPLPDDATLAQSEARVHAAALTVARLTEDLKLALTRLEDVRADARVTAERVAAGDAMRAIARARRVG